MSSLCEIQPGKTCYENASISWIRKVQVCRDKAHKDTLEHTRKHEHKQAISAYAEADRRRSRTGKKGMPVCTFFSLMISDWTGFAASSFYQPYEAACPAV